MIKLILVLLCLVLSFNSYAVVQDDSLRILLSEREQLVKDYHFYNAQNSNFWGKKSKKDLLLIIETLKGIIRKDTEIINTIKTTTLRKAAAITLEQTKLSEKVKGDQLSVSNTMYALKTQINNLQNLDKSRQRRINELQELIEHEKTKKRTGDTIIAFTVLALLSLLVYSVNLRRKLNQLKPVSRK